MIKRCKTSEILKESLKYLWNGYGSLDYYGTPIFVCKCIRKTYLPGNEKVIKMIGKRLGRSALVQEKGIEGWLQNRGIKTHKYHTKTIQRYRKRWVLSMIDEFEAKGD